MVGLILSACSQGTGLVDDRPPAFRHEVRAVFWETGDPEPPSLASFEEWAREMGLAVLLIPSAPQDGGDATFMVSVETVDFDRTVHVRASPEGETLLEVVSGTPTEMDCGNAATEVVVRGEVGCLNVRDDGGVAIYWSEAGWVHLARWSGTTGLAERFIDWLDSWTAVG